MAPMIDTKVAYFDRLHILLPEDPREMLGELSDYPEIYADKELHFEAIRDSIFTINAYRRQLAEGGSTIPAAEASRAWDKLHSVLRTSGPALKEYMIAVGSNRNADAAARRKGDFCRMALEHLNVIELCEANEKNAEPETPVFFRPEEPGDPLPADALPHIDALSRASIVPQLAALTEERGKFGYYARTLSDVIDHFDQLNRTGRSTHSSNEIHMAWESLRAGSANVLRDIGSRLASMSPSDRRYPDLSRAVTLMGIVDDAVRRVDAKTRMRDLQEQEARFDRKFLGICEELTAPEDDRSVSVFSHPEEIYGESAPEKAYNETIDALRSYRWDLARKGGSFANELRKLNQQIAEARRELPEDLLRSYDSKHDLSGIRDLAENCAKNKMPAKDVDALWKLAGLEGRKVVLAEANTLAYTKAREAAAAAVLEDPKTALCGKLAALSGRLGKMHKFGANTTEYRRFRSALAEAAKTGETGTLMQEAVNYIRAKDLGGTPTSSNGIARYGLAKEVLALLSPIEAQRGISLIPEKAQQAPEAVSEIDIVLGGDGIHVGDEEPEPQEQVEAVEIDLENMDLEDLESGEPVIVDRAPVTVPQYIPLGCAAVDELQNTLPSYFRDILKDMNYDDALADSLTDRLMYVLNKNLTGEDTALDSLKRDFYAEFSVMGVDETTPLARLPERTFLVPMRFAVDTYNSAIRDLPDGLEDMRVSLGNDEDRPLNARERILLRQEVSINKKLLPFTESGAGRAFYFEVKDILNSQPQNFAFRKLLVDATETTFKRLFAEYQKGTPVKTLLQNVLDKTAAKNAPRNSQPVNAARNRSAASGSVQSVNAK